MVSATLKVHVGKQANPALGLKNQDMAALKYVMN